MAPQQVAKWQPTTHMGNAGVGSQGGVRSMVMKGATAGQGGI